MASGEVIANSVHGYYRAFNTVAEAKAWIEERSER
jgi:hypothetical protein